MLCFSNPVFAGKNDVRLPHSDNWVPYYYKDPSGNYTGTDFELLKNVLENIGHQLEEVKRVPRKRLFKHAEKYHYNALFAVTHNPQRSNDFHFSIPYRTEQIAVFSAKPSILRYANIKQVVNSEHIGVMNMAAFFGDAFEFLKISNRGKLIHSENAVQQINLLVRGRSDYLVGDVDHHIAMLTKKNIRGVLQSNYYVSQNPVHFIFLKTDFSEAFMQEFNGELKRQLLKNKNQISAHRF